MEPKAKVGMFSWDKPHSGKTKKELIELVRALKRDSQGAWEFAAVVQTRYEQQTESLQEEISKWQDKATQWAGKYAEARLEVLQARENALQQATAPLQEKPSRITRGNVIHLLRHDNC